MTNGLPEELVGALRRKHKQVWRPLNTYGLLFIGLMVGMTLGYSIAIL
jgi:hypothetical protein